MAEILNMIDLGYLFVWYDATIKNSHKIVKGYFSYAMNSVLSQNNENTVCASGLSVRISNLSKTLNKKDRKCELYYVNGTSKTRMCTKYTSRWYYTKLKYHLVDSAEILWIDEKVCTLGNLRKTIMVS